VTIWDAGTYDLEKWRDGEEVIVTIHGEKHGSHRYALIHTGGDDEKSANNWLMHLMTDNHDVSKKSHHHAKSAPLRKTETRTKIPTPMLATLGTTETLSGEDDWAFEMKWDGVRALADVGSDFRLWSR
jgi:bifunctional non-homologous end joining protein LigD